MRKVFYASVLVWLSLFCSVGRAAHVQFTFRDVDGGIWQNKPLKITPVNAPGDAETRLPITTNTFTGTIIVSNLAALTYDCVLTTPLGISTSRIQVPNTNGLVYSSNLVVTTGLLTADDQFVRKLSSWSSSQTLTNPIFNGSTNLGTFTNGAVAGYVLTSFAGGGLALAAAPGASGGEANVLGHLGTTNTTDTFSLEGTKSGVSLLLPSLRAGANISLTNQGTNIVIASTGGGSSTGYVFNANQFAADNVTNVSIKSGVQATNIDANNLTNRGSSLFSGQVTANSSVSVGNNIVMDPSDGRIQGRYLNLDIGGGAFATWHTNYLDLFGGSILNAFGITNNGVLTNQGSFSVKGPATFYGPVSNQTLTASRLVGTDANQKEISYSAGTGIAFGASSVALNEAALPIVSSLFQTNLVRVQDGTGAPESITVSNLFGSMNAGLPLQQVKAKMAAGQTVTVVSGGDSLMSGDYLSDELLELFNQNYGYRGGGGNLSDTELGRYVLNGKTTILYSGGVSLVTDFNRWYGTHYLIPAGQLVRCGAWSEAQSALGWTALPGNVYEVIYAVSNSYGGFTFYTNGVALTTIVCNTNVGVLETNVVFRYTNATVETVYTQVNCLSNTVRIFSLGIYDYTKPGVVWINQAYPSHTITEFNSVPLYAKDAAFRAWNPDIIMFKTFNGGATVISNALPGYTGFIQSNCPNAAIVMSGCHPGEVNDADIVAENVAIKKICYQAGGITPKTNFVYFPAHEWLYDSFTFGKNQGYLQSGSQIHLTQSGAEYLARAMWSQMNLLSQGPLYGPDFSRMPLEINVQGEIRYTGGTTNNGTNAFGVYSGGGLLGGIDTNGAHYGSSWVGPLKIANAPLNSYLVNNGGVVGSLSGNSNDIVFQHYKAMSFPYLNRQLATNGPIMVMEMGDSLNGLSANVGGDAFGQEVMNYFVTNYGYAGALGQGIALGPYWLPRVTAPAYTTNNDFTTWYPSHWVLPNTGILVASNNVGTGAVLGNVYEVDYVASNGFGGFTVETNVNNGTYATLTTLVANLGAGIGPTGMVYRFTNTVSCPTTLRITCISNTVKILSVGIMNYTTNGGVILNDFAYAGTDLSQFGTVPTNIMGPILRAWKPDLAIYRCIDGNGAFIAANLPKWNTFFDYYLTNTDLLIVGLPPAEHNDVSGIVLQNLVWFTNCIAKRQAYFDGYSIFGDWTNGYRMGYLKLGDDPHFTQAGAAFTADAIASWMNVFNTAHRGFWDSPPFPYWSRTNNFTVTNGAFVALGGSTNAFTVQNNSGSIVGGVQSNGIAFLTISNSTLQFPANYTVFTLTADGSVTNITTTTNSLWGTGVGSRTLPANFWTVGRRLDAEIEGPLFDGATPGVCRLLAMLNSSSATNIAAQVAFTPPASVTLGDFFRIKTSMTCRTTGASGTIQTVGSVEMWKAGVDTTFSVTNTVLTVDTTIALTIDHGFTNGAATDSWQPKSGSLVLK